MEKITKEELLEKLDGVPLSDDELEKVSGGEDRTGCMEKCMGVNPPPDITYCLYTCTGLY